MKLSWLLSSYFIVLIMIFCFSCKPSKQSRKTIVKEEKNTAQTSKIHGVNFVSTNNSVTPENFKSLEKINANWVAIIPFSYMKDNDATVYFNSSWQWFGETPEGTVNYIQSAKANKLKTLIKPHIWPANGWIGELDFKTDQEWGKFEETYQTYILTFAKIAQEQQAEMFCIGVELKKIVRKRPQYFIKLIKEVKKVYKGQITYAANWDNYQNITFWNDLDHIGIDGYFPISIDKTPSVEKAIEKWSSINTELEEFSKKLKKPILFTEYGYRNIDYAGKQPWIDDQQPSLNNEAQSNLYSAFYESIWKKKWFTGGFLWKWYPNHSTSGGKNNNRFTPQNKPVEEIIKKKALM